MPKLIRKYLIPALIVALSGTGISFAATGSVVPFHQDDTTTVSNTDPTTEVEPTPESDDQNEEVTQNENEKEADTEQEDTTDTPKSSPKVRSTEGCPEGFTGNHGQFVSQSEDKQAAAHSNCGKPIQSVDKKDKEKDDDNEAPENEHEDNGKHNGHDKPGHSGDDEGENETGS